MVVKMCVCVCVCVCVGEREREREIYIQRDRLGETNGVALKTAIKFFQKARTGIASLKLLISNLMV